MAISVSAVSVTTPDGSSKSLGDYAGKVLLIVNVASRCGFTKQYAGLQSLNEAYADKGLAVLGFPCNDFGAQEPGTLDEIKSFCSTTMVPTSNCSTRCTPRGAPQSRTPLSIKRIPLVMWSGTSRSSWLARTAL